MRSYGITDVSADTVRVVATGVFSPDAADDAAAAATEVADAADADADDAAAASLGVTVASAVVAKSVAAAVDGLVVFPGAVDEAGAGEYDSIETSSSVRRSVQDEATDDDDRDQTLTLSGEIEREEFGEFVAMGWR